MKKKKTFRQTTVSRTIEWMLFGKGGGVALEKKIGRGKLHRDFLDYHDRLRVVMGLKFSGHILFFFFFRN